MFVDKYKKGNPEADLLKLDAVTLPTNKMFDCIYSNKVLHHLTREDLKKSIQRQSEIVNPNGIVFHQTDTYKVRCDFSGLQFNYHPVSFTTRSYL